MRRDTAYFSMYSDISIRINLSSSSNRNSANALASSVFPVPVLPAKRNTPTGRLGGLTPLEQYELLLRPFE